MWPLVTSTRDNCLGNKCPEFSRCHVAIARREALDADIVIVNHHLLLADLVWITLVLLCASLLSAD